MENNLQNLGELIEKEEELLRSGASELSEKRAGTRVRLASVLEDVKETGREWQEKAVKSARATDRVIRENPYQSLGIAFGVGVLIGVLINRK